MKLTAEQELERPETGQEAAPSGGNELRNRILSALVLGSAAIAAAAIGGTLFLLFWTAAALWLFWELVGIVGVESRGLVTAVGLVAILAMALALAFDVPALALICALIGAGIVVATAYPRRVWAGLGVIYAGGLLVPCVMLRADPAFGFAALLWLFAVVWAGDIASYFSGRMIGGPRLAERVSPNKTWSGAVGGLIGALAAGSAVLFAAGIAWRPMHLAVTLLVAVAAQFGDLFESAIKRRFGVKDASKWIPGHGGLMDRVDGFIAACVIALVFGLSRGGAAAPATGLLVW